MKLLDDLKKKLILAILDDLVIWKLKLFFLLIFQVVDWILGPGEKLLASMTDIGDSCESAEVLRKRHEELEIKCAVCSNSVSDYWTKCVIHYCVIFVI